MATTPERIATLESDKNWHWVALCAITVGAVAWLSYVTITLSKVTGDLQAIRQKLADGGLGAVVSQLEKPKTAQQLRANLDFVSSKIALDRASGKEPDRANLPQLSSVVRQATIKNPTLTEGWKAAFQLISYQSQANSIPSTSELPSCLSADDTPIRQLEATTDEKVVGGGRFVFAAEACELNLSDPRYAVSDVKRFFEAVRRRFPNNGNYIVLKKCINHLLRWSAHPDRWN